MFLLDTNVLSELRRPERAHRSVLAWASRFKSSDFFLSAMTILEIELGTLRMVRRDRAHAAVLRIWIDQSVVPRFRGRILPIDEAVAQRCARIQAQATRPDRDALIAATALVHGLKMVTRNVADFEACGVEILNPWD
jgi:hypothetical protein